MLVYSCFSCFLMISQTMTAGSVNILSHFVEGAESNIHIVFQSNNQQKKAQHVCLLLLVLFFNDFTNYGSRLCQHTFQNSGRCGKQ